MAEVSWAVPFAEWTLKIAQDFIASLKDEEADKSYRLYSGDGWLDGEGWKLPLPDDAKQKEAIQKIFIHEPLIAEAANNHRDGVISREPLWRYVKAKTPRSPRRRVPKALPAPELPKLDEHEDPRIVQLEEAQTEKWDERDTLLIYQEATVTTLFYGRAPLRQYVPSGLRRPENGTLAAADLAAALRLTYLEAPHPALAGVCTHDSTKRQCGVYLYRDAKGDEYAELSYLDESNVLTVLRVVGKDGDAAPLWFGDLGGRLLVYEMKGPRLFGESERQNQVFGNFAKTIMARQLELGGYRERNYLNVQPPGYWVNESGEAWTGKPGEKRARFIATTLPTGPGIDRYFQGSEMISESGEFKGFATPALAYEDPVTLAESERGLNNARLSILSSTGQLYLAMTGDGAASAVSRIQARAVHESRLGPRKAMLDGGIRWHLETEARMAAVAFSGAAYVSEFRAESNAIIDTGPITPDERRAFLEQAEKGYLSMETFLARTGEDDPDAEKRKIDAEDQARDERTLGVVSGRAATAGQGTGDVDPEAALEAELGQGAA